MMKSDWARIASSVLDFGHGGELKETLWLEAMRTQALFKRVISH